MEGFREERRAWLEGVEITEWFRVGQGDKLTKSSCIHRGVQTLQTTQAEVRALEAKGTWSYM